MCSPSTNYGSADNRKSPACCLLWPSPKRSLASRVKLVNILLKIVCPPKLHSMIRSFHDDMKGTTQYEGSMSERYETRLRPCVLEPTLIGIFCLLLKHAFGTSSEWVYLQTRSDGRLFNHARLRAKTKVHETLTRDMLFADEAAVTLQTEQQLQCLMDRFSQS